MKKLIRNYFTWFLGSCFGLVASSFVSLTISFAAAASTESKMSYFKFVWSASDVSTQKTDKFKFSYQIRQRLTPVAHQLVPVVTVTQGLFESTDAAVMKANVPPKLQDLIQTVYEIKKWKIDSRDEYVAYEGMAANYGVYVKLFVQKKENQVSFSLATLQAGYAYKTYFETENVQRDFIKSSFKTPTKSAQILWPQAFLRTAEAAGTGDDKINALANDWNRAGPLAVVSPTYTDTITNITNTGNIDANTILSLGKQLLIGTIAGPIAFHAIGDLALKGVKALYHFAFATLSKEDQESLYKKTDEALGAIGPAAEELRKLNNRANAMLLAFSKYDPETRSMQDFLDFKTHELERRMHKLDQALQGDLKSPERAACWAELMNAQDAVAQIKAMTRMSRELEKQNVNFCAEFDRLSTDLKGVQLQLYQAKVTILENTSFAMTKLNEENKVVDRGEKGLAGLTPRSHPGQSERVGLKDCRKNKEGLDKITDGIKEGACDCEAQVNSNTCQWLCSSQKSVLSIYDLCVAAVKQRESVDENKRQALGYQYTQDVVAKLGQLQGDLAESLCTSEKGKSDCKKTSADSGIDSAVVSKKIDSLVASCQRANLGQFRPVTSVLSEYLLGCAKAKAPETCNLPVASIPNGPNSLAESAGFLEPQCGCRVSPALTSKTE